MEKALVKHSMALVVALSIAALADSPAGAQSTAFTYQGRLDDAGQPTSGLHDFRFRLFDVASGGMPIGYPLCVDNVSVIDGVFSVLLDFGQQYATTAQRHLEIEVRRDTGLPCANEAGFVVMTPRQQLTATPIASHANSAFSLDAADGSPASAVFVDDSGNVGIGTTTPAARLDVRGGPILVENLGDQADLLWLASERSWVFRQENTGAETALKLESIGGGGNKHFIVQTTGFMGVGTTSPLAKLDVHGDIRLGPIGEYQATAGVENLRLLRGEVDGNGSRVAGSGFTSRRDMEGQYTLTFDTPFLSRPTFISVVNGALEAHFIDVLNLTTSQVTLRTLFVDPRQGHDVAWSFYVIGPR
jgi:hypothetical protein